MSRRQSRTATLKCTSGHTHAVQQTQFAYRHICALWQSWNVNPLNKEDIQFICSVHICAISSATPSPPASPGARVACKIYRKQNIYYFLHATKVNCARVGAARAPSSLWVHNLNSFALIRVIIACCHLRTPYGYAHTAHTTFVYHVCKSPLSGCLEALRYPITYTLMDMRKHIINHHSSKAHRQIDI